MTLKLIDNEYYGGGDGRAINRHHTKTYRVMEDTDTVVCLSRCIDVDYFEAWESTKYSGIRLWFPPMIKIDRKERWGEGISWKAAFKKFEEKLKRVWNDGGGFI